MGKRGQWSRWGGGMCEGWLLEIGTAFRGSVVRQDRIEAAPTWLASLNSTYLSEHPDRESAMARVEAAIAHDMGFGPARLGVVSGEEGVARMERKHCVCELPIGISNCCAPDDASIASNRTTTIDVFMRL